MTFPRKVVEDLLVASHRCCCLCHRYCGTKIEVHHIIPRSEGGQDTMENAIALCFDCHAEVESYNTKHPKGRKFSPSELKKHKEQWLKTCSSIRISKEKGKASEVTPSEKELYTKIYDSVFEQAENIIRELEDRRKKISFSETSFIVSVSQQPETKSIFLSFEGWQHERKNIDDDLRYCEKTLSKIKSMILALRVEDRGFFQSEFMLLEQSFEELRGKKNKFLRSMENLKSYNYHSYDSLEAFYMDLRVARDVCYKYDIECKEKMINFLDKALKILYSMRVFKNSFHSNM